MPSGYLLVIPDSSIRLEDMLRRHTLSPTQPHASHEREEKSRDEMSENAPRRAGLVSGNDNSTKARTRLLHATFSPVPAPGGYKKPQSNLSCVYL